MTQDLSAVKSELLKIARGLESGEMSVNETEGSAEEVMDLVEEAVEILEEVKQITPAEESHEEEDSSLDELDNLVAKVRKAIETNDDDSKKDDDEDDDSEKDAKVIVAAGHGSDDDDDEEDKEKDAKTRLQEARIATLENELNSRNRIAIAESAQDFYPEDIRSAKISELVKSKGSNRSLEAKIKFAREILKTAHVQKSTYRSIPSTSGIFTKKAKQVAVQAWKV